MSTRIFFSVGEPSGDQHAARLINRLLSSSSNVTARGFGGQAMKDAGCQLDLDLTEYAVVGLVEVLPKLRQFFRFVDQAEVIFRNGEVDAVVLVDFPGFNWHIARRAKEYGIPVFYYCPPQLWAWGAWRVKKMRRSVDHVLAVLPIEEQFFSKHGIPTTYVGHPFFDAVKEQKLDVTFINGLSQSAKVPQENTEQETEKEAGQKIVAVLPGSRTHEVHANWPLMLASMRQLSQQHPTARFLVASYRESQRDWCRSQMTSSDHSLPIDFHVGKTSEIIEVSHCSMMVSGSVSLEMMARRTPAAVIYRVGRVMYGFGKCVVGVDSMTLPNLMGPTKVYPEMVSVGDPQPAIDFLTCTVASMLSDPYYYRKTVQQLDALRSQHAMGGGTQRAADWIAERLELAQSDELGQGYLERAA